MAPSPPRSGGEGEETHDSTDVGALVRKMAEDGSLPSTKWRGGLGRGGAFLSLPSRFNGPCGSLPSPALPSTSVWRGGRRNSRFDRRWRSCAQDGRRRLPPLHEVEGRAGERRSFSLVAKPVQWAVWEPPLPRPPLHKCVEGREKKLTIRQTLALLCARWQKTTPSPPLRGGEGRGEEERPTRIRTCRRRP
jgi:hypothetical protein